MWLNKMMNQNQNNEMPTLAVVTAVNGNTIQAICQTQVINVPLVQSFGIVSLPLVGDEVLLLPICGGEYVCLGKVLMPNVVLPNETIVSCNGKAKIKLAANGEIQLNDTVIARSV